MHAVTCARGVYGRARVFVCTFAACVRACVVVVHTIAVHMNDMN